jgi:hypothetical protein
MLLESIFSAIVFWTAGYVLLSLSLALIWITLVFFAHAWRDHQAARPFAQPLRPLGSARHFRRWQRANTDFVQLLEHLASLQGAPRSGES